MKAIESKQVKIILVIIAIAFFYIGDIITTWLILSQGGVELNRFLVGIGFTGYLVFKTGVTILFCGIIYYSDRVKFHTMSGVVIGIMLITGILATLFNLGVFGN